MKKDVDRPTGRFYGLGMPLKNATGSKRDELVEIASDLFYRQGYGATGVKQIIEAAGIAKGTFYSHFASKEEVGVAWLRQRHADWNSWLETQLDEGRGAKAKLIGLFDFLESWMQSCDFRGCAFLNTLSEVTDPVNPMRDEIATHKRSLQELIQKLSAEHFGEGKASALSRQKGYVMFLLFEGALVEAQNYRDLSPILAARKEVRKMLSGESR